MTFRIPIERTIRELEAAKANVPQAVKRLSADSKFWAQVDDALEVILPISEILKMSESDHHRLAHVLEGWEKIYNHLCEQARSKALPNIEAIFRSRFEKQCNDLHFAAYFVHPKNATKKTYLWYSEQDVINKISRSFRDYCDDPVATMAMFQQFRNRQNIFNPDSEVWAYKDNPHTFWDVAINARPLNTFARRLAITPANSVASERSFSILNLMQNKLRNSLHGERVDQLQYIYMNERALERNTIRGQDKRAAKKQRIEEEKRSQEEVEEEERLLLEENLMAQGEDGSDNPDAQKISQQLPLPSFQACFGTI